jgi:hypothetical protein
MPNANVELDVCGETEQLSGSDEARGRSEICRNKTKGGLPLIITNYLLTLVYISDDYTLECKFQVRCVWGEPSKNCNCNHPIEV